MRFQLHRSASLRKLRTAFSRNSTPSSSTNSSPEMNQRAWSPASDCSNSSTHSNTSIREILALRRRPSGVELDLEEEARSFPDEVGLLEPRPEAPPTTRGLFEVLDGHQ
jgi:hypothetical protein